MLTRSPTTDNFAMARRLQTLELQLTAKFASSPFASVMIFVERMFDHDNASSFFEQMMKHTHADINDFTMFARYLKLRFNLPLMELNELMYPFVFKMGSAGRIQFDRFDNTALGENPFNAPMVRCFRSETIRNAMMSQATTGVRVNLIHRFNTAGGIGTVVVPRNHQVNLSYFFSPIQPDGARTPAREPIRTPNGGWMTFTPPSSSGEETEEE